MADFISDTDDLMERARQGDTLARHRLLEQFRDYLRRMVSVRLDRRVSPRIDASDVVQETLVEADRRLDGYLQDRPLPFYAWLRQIAGDRIIEAHRFHVASKRRSVNREALRNDLSDGSSVALTHFLLADDTSPSNRLVKQEKRETIRQMIDALPEKDREVLVMRHLEQLSTAEIAATLGITEAAVKSRLVRGLVRLRSMIQLEM